MLFGLPDRLPHQEVRSQNGAGGAMLRLDERAAADG